MMDCNVGGYFGPYLKFTGYDALVLTGIASEQVIVYIDAPAGRITIEKAPLESVDSHLIAEELTEMYADGDLDKKNIAVVSAGRGAEHAYMGCLNFSFYDWRRQVGAPQAGRPRRPRHGLPPQERQGAGHQAPRHHARLARRGEQGRAPDHAAARRRAPAARGPGEDRADRRPLAPRSRLRDRDDAGHPGASSATSPSRRSTL